MASQIVMQGDEMMKIIITARNFSNYCIHALRMLTEAGHEVLDYGDRDLGNGTDEAVLYSLVRDADIVICGSEPYGESLLKRCQKLKMLSIRGIGYDSKDIAYCKTNQITIARAFGTVEGAVAEHVMAYILYFARRIDLQNASMQEGRWERMMMEGAKGRKLGLVGFGGIGKEIAKRALAFGMEVHYFCRHPNPEWEFDFDVAYKPMDALLNGSDYVCACVPLTPDTRNLFDASSFRKMKPGSYFINIARGAVMDPLALRAAMECGQLSGAGIDVFDREPCTDSVLIGCKKAILTPHTAPYTQENFTQMNNKAAQNVLDYIAGNLPAETRVV